MYSMTIALSELSGEYSNALAPHDKAYLAGLEAQRRDPQHKQVVIGETFIPSSLMTESERQDILGVVPYELIKGNMHYKQLAEGVHVHFHPMDAGLGSSVIRDTYLASMGESVDRSMLSGKNGSKSTDLYIPYPREDGSQGFMSIAEIKIRSIIHEASSYGGISLTPIINEDSLPAMKSVYDVYEPFFQEYSISNGRWLKQGDLPTWDIQAGVFSTEHIAPGGHGQAGVMLLHEIMASEDEGVPVVRTVFNGDGTNNSVTPEMVAYTAEEAGIVMLTTTRTPADVKGGIIGGKMHADGAMTPDICELAQAKKAGQTDLFMTLGIEGETAGTQFFNTNTVLMNEGALRPFLKAVEAAVGEETFEQLLTPELILNTKEKNGKQFDQLEGALGSLILRLNEAVQTNSEIQKIWEQVSGGKQFLKIINTNPDDRDETCTPNKFPVDFMIQSSSDHFYLDTTTWKLVNTRPGHIPRMEGDLVQKGYYSNVSNVLGTFGHAQIRELDVLHMEGAFICPDAVWKGHVQLISRYADPIHLNLPEIRSSLGIRDGEPLTLENVSIVVDEQGSMRIEKN